MNNRGWANMSLGRKKERKKENLDNWNSCRENDLLKGVQPGLVHKNIFMWTKHWNYETSDRCDLPIFETKHRQAQQAYAMLM